MNARKCIVMWLSCCCQAAVKLLSTHPAVVARPRRCATEPARQRPTWRGTKWDEALSLEPTGTFRTQFRSGVAGQRFMYAPKPHPHQGHDRHGQEQTTIKIPSNKPTSQTTGGNGQGQAQGRSRAGPGGHALSSSSMQNGT